MSLTKGLPGTIISGGLERSAPAAPQAASRHKQALHNRRAPIDKIANCPPLTRPADVFCSGSQGEPGKAFPSLSLHC